MSASKIDPILAQLTTEVGNFEKTLLELIQYKKQNIARSAPLMEINNMNQPIKTTPIAIIGMASLFPEAKNLQEYWDNIMREVDCITEVPASRWDIDTYYDPDPKAQDKTYCKRGGFIPDIDFNPMEFGLPPNILEFTDVSQLISLVIAKKAMEDAGYGETREFNREQAGVILGAAVGRPLSGPLTARMQYPVWEKVLKNSGLSDEDTQKIVQKIKLAYLDWEENAFPGMLTNVIAGRIANRLDFGGTNCAIDAACASSLSAFKMAVSELSEHRADLMLTGGIDIDNSIVTYLCFSKTPALSKRQESRPFDIHSDGMMVGEGVGMLVLKRLADAERDGDRIYAVIKGIGSSSDGRYKSIYAPRPEGQARALVRAYEEAGFSPTTVGLIEAHGTGTGAGDPAEFAALNQVFSEANAPTQSVALGSVKSQIGHTKAAAGAASLIKATLALHHKVLPATLNITQPNPKLGITTSPFYLNTKTRPWMNAAGSTPRRAGVSSFGFGGTNFHIVLEEYEPEPQQTYRLHSTVQSLLLAAPTPEQLLERCQEMHQRLRADGSDREYAAFVDSSKNLPLPLEFVRLGFVAGSRTDACNLLQLAIEQLRKDLTTVGWNHPLGIYYRKTGIATAGKVVALFSGQGSQYLDMGRELAINFPELRQGYSVMDQLFVNDGLTPLSTVVFPPPVFDEAAQQAQSADLQRTEYAQPAIGMFSTGLFKLLQQAGFNPDFVAGHSFGELTALWAAGVLNDADYVVLVKARGQAMAVPQAANFDAGAMLAIKGDLSRIEPLLQQFPDVTLANLNSAQQVVLAGARADITQMHQILTDQADPTITAILLPVAAAFHTPRVAHAQKPFAQAIEAITFSRPTLPVYTNVTGERYPTEPEAIQTILKEHLTHQVFFQQEIEAIYADGGYCFIEFGPKQTLTNLVKEILGHRPHEAIALNANWRKDSDRQLREAVIQLRVIGLALADLDPYQRERPIVEMSAKAKQLSVRLSATNYVSEKTKTGFDQALQDGHQVTFAVQPTDLVDPAVPLTPPSLASQPAEIAVEKVVSVPLSSALKIPATAVLNGDVHHRSTPVGVLSDQSILPANGHSSAHLTQRQAPSGNSGNGQALTQNSLSSGQNGHSVTVTGAMSEATRPSDQSAQVVTRPSHSPSASGVGGSQPSQPVSMQQPSEPKGVPMAQLPLNYQRVLESLESSLDHFSQHQRDLLHVHEQYLHQHLDYAQAFLDLTQQQNALLAPIGQPGDSMPSLQAVVESVERSMDQFHQYHGETLRVHDQALQRQSEHVQTFFQVLYQQYAGIVTGEITALEGAPSSPQIVSPEAQQIQGKLTEFAATIATPPHLAAVGTPVPVKTHQNGNGHATVADNGAGAPAPVTATVGLAPETVVPPVLPPLVTSPQMPWPPTTGSGPGVKQSLIAPLPELAVNPVGPEALPPNDAVVTGNGTANGKSSIAPPASVAPPAPEPPAPPSAPEITATVDPEDAADLIAALLAIVSDKTGYPADMLELDLDMEADLGIDSIKRVEILGAMQQQFPDSPAMNPEDLGELRTLGQIITQMQRAQAGAAPAVPAAPAPASTSVQPVESPAEARRSGVLEAEAPPVAQSFPDAVPTISQTVPTLPTVSAPEPPVAAPDNAVTAQETERLVTALLAIVSDKTGYPADMLELDLDMEADLGIDSIKRVEILGAMQQQFPDYPAMNPEDLGELRTLGQIITQMEKAATGGEKKTPVLASSSA